MKAALEWLGLLLMGVGLFGGVCGFAVGLLVAAVTSEGWGLLAGLVTALAVGIPITISADTIGRYGDPGASSYDGGE
ncbi:ABC-type antimicrobial peptide transport system permease subunit [Nonomuraea thailandensis]|uniref:ABC-type antimicrobial peptide transport system permease subunit n=1 Tax=Nonomuraea thailandensis TaxID=1188745 RepID=A0A9X2K2Q7_9ACTN|nr:hypothetical protein [Nonomuraea thailandensis]MCP2357579.1 ABC-type antimicrobial peptide transport system permease subunit [Nonomuraea thailandensis]